MTNSSMVRCYWVAVHCVILAMAASINRETDRAELTEFFLQCRRKAATAAPGFLAAPAFLGLAVEPVGQAGVALFLGFALWRGRLRLRGSGIAGEAERLQSLGLDAERR